MERKVDWISLIRTPAFLHSVMPFVGLTEVSRLVRLSRELRESLLASESIWTALLVRYRMGLQKGYAVVHDRSTLSLDGSVGGFALPPMYAARAVLSIVTSMFQHGAFIDGAYVNLPYMEQGEAAYSVVGEVCPPQRRMKGDADGSYETSAEGHDELNDAEGIDCVKMDSEIPKEKVRNWLISRRWTPAREFRQRAYAFSPCSTYKFFRGEEFLGTGNTLRNVAPGDYYVMWRMNWFEFEPDDYDLTFENDCIVQCTPDPNYEFPMRGDLEERDSKVFLWRRERILDIKMVRILKKYAWIDLRMEKVRVPSVAELAASENASHAHLAEKGGDLRFSIWIDLTHKVHPFKSGNCYDIMYLWPVRPDAAPIDQHYSEEDIFPLVHSCPNPAKLGIEPIDDDIDAQPVHTRRGRLGSFRPGLEWG